MRVFEDSSVIHVANKVDPMQDVGIINLELVLADMEVVSKRMANLGRELKKNDKEAILEDGILKRFFSEEDVYNARQEKLIELGMIK